jgi:hypothetical protein
MFLDADDAADKLFGAAHAQATIAAWVEANL